ncbi:MAG: ribonuclease D [Flammeovirgaceae bacterium]|jgi:ribonuclease D
MSIIKQVENNKELESCIEHLQTVPEFGIDLEFDKNRFRYGFNLCLMQIFSGEICFIIDPLSEGLEIEKIFPVIENPAIQKITFAFGEDLRLLHSLGCFPKNIYDTTNAIKLLNYPQKSLSFMLNEILEIPEGDSAQMSNWFKRPLTEKQVTYAAEDVLHLLELKKALEKQAEAKNISDWVAQENAILSQVNYADAEDNTLYRKKDKKELTQHEWFLMKALIDFRETIAKKYNKPSHQIVSNDTLMSYAQNPSRVKNWEYEKGVFRGIKNSSTQNKISQLLQKASNEAKEQGLSQTDSAIEPLSRENYNKFRKSREREDELKTTVFKPIQLEIAKDYGENTAFFALSNKFMSSVISKSVEFFPEYKAHLLIKYAEKLEVDVSEFLEEME